MTKSLLFAAALTLVACGGGTKCTTTADCGAGQICDAASGVCQAGTTGGGFGTTGGGTGTTGGGTEGGGSGGGTAGGSGGGGGGSGGGTGQNSNGGDTCAMAVAVTGATVNGETVGSTNDYSPPGTCTGFLNPGPDTVYKVSVPAGQRISVRATSNTSMPDQYDLSLYLVASPASNCDAVNADGGSAIVCLSGSDDADLIDAIETATWFNDTGAAVEVFVVVDSGFGMTVVNPDGGQGIANEGAFSLDIQVVAPNTMGDRCDTAIALTSGTALPGQDLANFGNDYQPSVTETTCAGKGSSDITYKIDVGPGELLNVTATPSAELDLTLSVSETIAECGKTCILAADSAGAGGAESLVWKNNGTTAKTLFIVADGNFVTTGTFSITATVSTPPGDDTCNAPTVLTAGTPLANQTFDGYTDDYSYLDEIDGCGYSDGPDRTYTVEVPAGKRLTVNLTTTSPDLDANINIVEGQGTCDALCLGLADTGYEGENERLVFVNRTAVTQNYVLVVDSWDGYSAGSFTLEATLDDPPAGDTCQTATVLTSSLTAQTTVNYSADYGIGTGCAPSGYTYADHAFKVTVPGGERGVVTVSPALTADGGATFSPSISFVTGPADNCDVDPRVCQGGVAAAAGVRVGTYFNATTAPVEVFAIVDSTAVNGGVFDISFSSGVPAADDTCSSATTALSTTGATTGNLDNFVLDYATGTGCTANTFGKERVYTVTIPANRVMTFTATPTDTNAMTGPNLFLNFVATTAAVCDSATRTCAAAANATARGGVETLSYVNATAMPVTGFLVVGDTVANSASTAFSITSAESMIPASESCNSPEVIAASGTQVGLNFTNFSRQYVIPSTSMTCAAYNGAERVFSITVNPNQTLTATATSTTVDMVVNLIAGPETNCVDAPTCIAKSDDPNSLYTPETVTYTNAGAGPQTVFLLVSSYSASPSATGTFSLNVQIAP